MNNCFTFSLLLIFSIHSNAQYIEYHNLVNKANEKRYEKEYEKSLQLFQESFNKIEYVHSVNYVKAAITANKLKKHGLVELYLTKAIEKGYPTKIVNRKSFKKFRKSKHYLSFQDEIKSLENSLASKFNSKYKRKIDSLHYIDQNIIRGNNKITGFKLDLKISYSDSSNFACLLSLIDKYGFPSEQEIGYQGYSKSWVLIHHSARLIQNHSYHLELLKYVKSGAYLPENYCWVVDQGQELLNQNLIYYHWDVAKNINELTTKEMDEIDKRRKEVGLASVRRIEVVKNSTPKRNKVKW